MIRHDLLAALRAELADAADAAKAGPMQAYMKSAMPYRGVQSKPQREIHRRVFPQFPLDSFEDLHDTVLELWRTAEFREERYAAIALVGRYRTFLAPEALPLLEEIVVTGAWWDYVDPVAAHFVGPIVRAHPRLRRTMRAWARGPDLWKRRTAIIHQLGAKAGTDSALLADCVEPSLGSREFFLRKAVGWALREYAKTDPEWVVAYVRAHERELSPLSKREALKNVLNGRR